MAKVDPLRHNVPIVDQHGRPTPEFIRQWQTLLRQLADAEARLSELESDEEE